MEVIKYFNLQAIKRSLTDKYNGVMTISIKGN